MADGYKYYRISVRWNSLKECGSSVSVDAWGQKSPKRYHLVKILSSEYVQYVPIYVKNLCVCVQINTLKRSRRVDPKLTRGSGPLSSISPLGFSATGHMPRTISQMERCVGELCHVHIYLTCKQLYTLCKKIRERVIGATSTCSSPHPWNEPEKDFPEKDWRPCSSHQWQVPEPPQRVRNSRI